MEAITFYSYKGGVGRTLSLANIAVYLSRFGLNVCIVDFDLEAPGIHYKLQSLFSRPVEKGLVDYIYEFTSGGNIPGSLSEYVLTAENIPAGEGY
ncbi:MAG TPA: P-loop NTPase, partial [Candidatus Deferrimicrobium sp.]|nr:P-loop NTPase [Candidatus Deferrimicrobium sp.]